MNDEDWWRLVFDTDANRLYVEHEWHHTDVRGRGETDQGRHEMDIGAFLSQFGRGPEHRELVRLISGLFGDKAVA